MSDQRLSLWMTGTGPDQDVVLASRLRLARNIRGYSFPNSLPAEQGERLVGEVDAAVGRIRDAWHLKLERLKDISGLDRQVLVEKHLASPLLVADPIRFEEVATDDRESISIMVLEEDHLRMQVLLPGLQLDEAWNVANHLDDSLEESLTWAFDPKLGYLTTYPTNLGTAMRASVMAHLPALVLTRQAGPVFGALAQMGVVVRGLYGEGSEGEGHIFQISNQVSLGRSEEELVHGLSMVAQQVAGRERQARELLGKNSEVMIRDRVGRAFGILAHARVLTSEEAIRLLSDVKLGQDMGFLKAFAGATFSEMVSMTRPGILQRMAGQDLDAAGRDMLRADVIQQHLDRS
ncbi:MAG: protein arginine kinase [Clostridia bacterium]